MDVCMKASRPPTIKLIAFQRATPGRVAIMADTYKTLQAQRALADKKLKGWLWPVQPETKTGRGSNEVDTTPQRHRR